MNTALQEAETRRSPELAPEQPAAPGESPESPPASNTTGAGLTIRQAWAHWWRASLDLADALAHPLQMPTLFFLLALSIYLVTRLVRLEDFPIYFFADEAVQTLFAEQLIQSDFRDASGIYLPMYVEAAGSRWTPLLSMYFHALSVTLFGKSIFITRATSAVLSLLAPLSVGLILKNVFKTRTWWAGVLLLSMIPAWLLHSRTAFETVQTATFYACFLLGYLLYRTHSPGYLYLALVCAAATFYTYSNGQVVMLGAGVLLFLSDLPYHWQQRRTLLKGLVLGVVLALPFLLFRWHHPEALGDHLRVVNSYWYHPIPLIEKISIFLQKMAYGLSPQYWFLPNGQDLPRHRWDNQGHILLGLLPFVLAGVVICLRHVRSAPHRALLLSAIATPIGGALLEIGVTRGLAFVIPASLFAGLGLEWTLEQVSRLLSRPSKAPPGTPGSTGLKATAKTMPYASLLATTTFVILAFASFSLLRQALTEGPRWFSDYGLYGMQYGARQLFEETIPDLLARDLQAQVLVTSTWANGTDRFLGFFFDREALQRVRIEGVQTYLFQKLPLTSNEVFVMTPAEYEQAVNSHKLTIVGLEQTLYYPDGTTAFLFVRLAYAPDAEAIFAAEKEARRALVEAQVTWEGQALRIRHSAIDMGGPELIFDGDLFTLMRGLEANPFVLELNFPEPVSFSQVQADFGMAEVTLTALLYPAGQDEHLRYEISRSNAESMATLMSLDLPASLSVTRIRFEILDRGAGEVANIHIRELTLVP